MNNDFSERLLSVDKGLLGPVVRKILEDDSAEPEDWSMSSLTGGASQDAGYSYGLYRFRGNAVVGEGTVTWSVILKATAASLAGSDEPSKWDYWKREALAYRSGFLDDLHGGIVAPRCFGVDDVHEDEFWIWLEDVPEAASESIWALEDYGQAARHLGQFNGGYLTGPPLANRAWFSAGRVKDWLEWGGPVLEKLPDICRDGLAQRWFRGNSVDRTLRLKDEQTVFLELLARLPRTFCHHDAHRRNLILKSEPGGRNRTVAIDWQIAGSGAIGEELATLFGVTLQFLDFPVESAHELDRSVYESYLAGLRDAGWKGDERLVRYGFAASASLCIGVGAVGPYLTSILSDRGEALVRSVMGCGCAELVDRYAVLQEYLLALGDEARDLKEELT